MKRPLINQHDRQSIYCGTTLGAFLMLNLAWLKFLRDLFRKTHRHTWRIYGMSGISWKCRCECGAIKIRGVYPAHQQL